MLGAALALVVVAVSRPLSGGPAPELRPEGGVAAAMLPVASGGGSRLRRHDLHVTHTRMVVEGTTIACRIRLFKDDLEKALRMFSGRPDLTLGADTRADSLFAAYSARTLTIDADGSRVTLRVTASGTERDPAAQEVVWYLLEGEAPEPPRKLGLLNGLMFEMFRDQQNLVQLLREPGGVRKTLYFVSTDPREQILSF